MCLLSVPLQLNREPFLTAYRYPPDVIFMDSTKADADFHQTTQPQMFDNGQQRFHCSKLKTMHVESKKRDRRASRTRRSLNEALIALIREKRWEAITVQHVIDRANV